MRWRGNYSVDATVESVSCAALLMLLAVAGCGDDGTTSDGVGATADDSLSTQTPYAPPPDVGYGAPPVGYRAVFTQLVARHGSRALTSSDSIDYVTQLIDIATASAALTELGKALPPQVRELRRINEALGYGNLSSRGVREHRQLAARLLARRPELFNDAIRGARRISIIHSGKDRAVDSAKNFAASLADHKAGLANLIDPAVADQALLYFFKLDTAYQHWLTTDPQLKSTTDGIFYSERSHDEARRLLVPLVGVELADQLAAGRVPFTDPRTGNVVAVNDVDLASYLYNLYRVAPGLSDDGDADLSRFVPPETAEWFGYLNDVYEFYQKGPSFAGSTISFGNARVLQDDFFAVAASNCSAGTALAAKLRFAHAETLIPLAALLQLPLSDQQVALPDVYRYETNPWRGARVSPYAVNIQWDSYANAAGECLIAMLYDERPTRFKDDCQSIAADSVYYRLDELQRCYGY
jgi:hypothetical protein